MLGFCHYSDAPKLGIYIPHKVLNAGFQHSVIMILKLLTLRGLCTVKRSAGENQILAAGVHIPINQKILLLGTAGCYNTLGVVAEKLKDSAGRAAYSLHRAKKRGFGIERLAAVGAEGGGYVKSVVLYESI